jgi:predicted Rossmann fold flavoprotein
MHSFDVVIIGAGAAGLFCAGVAGQLGLKVLLIDHSEKVAEKIRISGGGRCNFTNRDMDVREPHKHFISANPKFCRSALSRYTPAHFISLLQSYNVPFHEKHKGQLFCDRSAQDVINVLLAECEKGQVTRWQPCAVTSVAFSASEPHGKSPSSYQIESDRGSVKCAQVVVATGGLPVPKIGATDFGLRLAKQFGLKVINPRPALVPLTFDAQQWATFAQLAGLSLPVVIATGGKKDGMHFAEDLLFTHRGLSGPGVLQISSYWQAGTPIRLDLAPQHQVAQELIELKQTSRKKVNNELATLLPARLAEAWVQQSAPNLTERAVNEWPDKPLQQLGERLNRWEITPTGTEGYAKAEVMAGGVDTACLSSQTLESRQPGLYFIGEVVDVTGWLGGYNFQWAWASGYACAHALAAKLI